MDKIPGKNGSYPEQWDLPKAAPTVDGQNPLRHHLETMVETITFVGIYRGINIPGFLSWCEMDFVHPQ